jgi:uncharacterized protein with von Willebrand factor type A (vWA) domain
MTDFGVQTIALDLPELAGRFGRRLHDAGLPVEPERAARFAAALALVRPVARRRLYFTARSVFVSDPLQVRIFDHVFAEVFGAGVTSQGRSVIEDVRQVPAVADDDRPVADLPQIANGTRHDDAWAAGAAAAPSRGRGEADGRQLPVGVVASEEEVIRTKRFDTLDAAELAVLYRLMSRLVLATPERRTRRFERRPHGTRIDMRRTLRGSLRTGGDPIRLARRRRRVVRRRLVLLCDISGSMEPYARAYLQFLTCAARAGDRHSRSEAFAFATRLTRLTRALHSGNPERAIQRAAATAPDWSSGTRIGDALKTFNDRHGRRGMARGAVVVILSDGWERGDPALVAREMERLSRLAHRIVWVNPRVAAAGFVPRAGGMTAALPWCDALVSGHSLEALEEVVDVIGGRRGGGGARERSAALGWAGTVSEEPEETWPSATPVPGSSVAMPSGYGPSRGRTTPGWEAMHG